LTLISSSRLKAIRYPSETYTARLHLRKHCLLAPVSSEERALPVRARSSRPARPQSSLPQMPRKEHDAATAESAPLID